jgi:hypothetical protein
MVIYEIINRPLLVSRLVQPVVIGQHLGTFVNILRHM